MKPKIFTSLYLSESLRTKLEQCVEKLDIDICQLLSMLCYKAGTFVCKEARWFRAVEYQERGGDYEITPVCFFAVDHEYMLCNRLACKVSVSKLLACAMVLFLDEIMEKGISQMELERMEQVQNSYKQKTFFIHNCAININKNDQFEEYIMRMRMNKRKT